MLKILSESSMRSSGMMKRQIDKQKRFRDQQDWGQMQRVSKKMQTAWKSRQEICSSKLMEQRPNSILLSQNLKLKFQKQLNLQSKMNSFIHCKKFFLKKTIIYSILSSSRIKNTSQFSSQLISPTAQSVSSGQEYLQNFNYRVIFFNVILGLILLLCLFTDFSAEKFCCRQSLGHVRQPKDHQRQALKCSTPFDSEIT